MVKGYKVLLYGKEYTFLGHLPHFRSVICGFFKWQHAEATLRASTRPKVDKVAQLLSTGQSQVSFQVKFCFVDPAPSNLPSILHCDLVPLQEVALLQPIISHGLLSPSHPESSVPASPTSWSPAPSVHFPRLHLSKYLLSSICISEVSIPLNPKMRFTSLCATVTLSQRTVTC